MVQTRAYRLLRRRGHATTVDRSTWSIMQMRRCKINCFSTRSPPRPWLCDYGETPPIFKFKRKRSCWLPGLYWMLLLFVELRQAHLHYANWQLHALFSEGVYKPLKMKGEYTKDILHHFAGPLKGVNIHCPLP